jgi:plasmid stabilization system protein ParE
MKGRPVRVQPRAKSHLNEAYEWYDEQRAGLGREFLEAIEDCIEQIADNPGMFPVHRGRIRRAVAHRFPYLIFYVVEERESVVIAVFHAARDPQNWP